MSTTNLHTKSFYYLVNIWINKVDVYITSDNFIYGQFTARFLDCSDLP